MYAVHLGLHNFSMVNLPRGFERLMKQNETNIDEFLNNSPFFVECSLYVWQATIRKYCTNRPS